MDRYVKIGIVGCGVMGRVYLKAAEGLESLRIAAVADVQEQAAEAAATEFGVPAWYGSAEAMIEEGGLDAVILAVPAAYRTEIALLAFAKGKHVLLEKPAALSAAEAERLLAASAGLVAAGCSSRLRFSDSYEALRRVVESGALGPLRTISCRWVVWARPKPGPDKLPPAWRLNPALNGGGNLTNLGSYVLDYMLGVTGWEHLPSSVSGRVWTLQPAFADHVVEGSAGETHSAAWIACGEGAGAPVLLLEQGEYIVGPEEAAWQIIGDQGTVRFRILPGQSNVVTLYKYDDVDGVTEEVVWAGEEKFDVLQRRLIEDFAEAILEGRAPRTTLAQACVLQRTIEAVYESSATGNTIEL